MKTYENFINKPDIEYYDNGQKKSERWYLNDKLHREDGPAIQHWYENGQKKSKRWWLNGKQHREDGPAYQDWYDNGQKNSERWWLNDINYTRGEWVEELKNIGSPHQKQKILLDTKKYNL